MGIERCFIVRVDAELDDELERHRQYLERRRHKRRVSLAEAARDLFARGLRERGALPKRRPRGSRRRQLELWT